MSEQAVQIAEMSAVVERLALLALKNLHDTAYGKIRRELLTAYQLGFAAGLKARSTVETK